MGGFKKWRDPSNGGEVWFWNGGIDTPLRTMIGNNRKKMGCKIYSSFNWFVNQKGTEKLVKDELYVCSYTS